MGLQFFFTKVKMDEILIKEKKTRTFDINLSSPVTSPVVSCTDFKIESWGVVLRPFSLNP